MTLQRIRTSMNQFAFASGTRGIEFSKNCESVSLSSCIGIASEILGDLTGLTVVSIPGDAIALESSISVGEGID